MTKLALLFWLTATTRTTRFNVTAQVVPGCRISPETAKVSCGHVEIPPRTMVAGGYFWVLF